MLRRLFTFWIKINCKAVLEVVLIIYVNKYAENYKYVNCNIIFLISVSLISIIFKYINKREEQ